jgi:acyl carrier protein
MNPQIESQLRDFLAKNILFEEGCGDLTDDASLIAEGVIDSIGITELVEFIHGQFGFEVPMRDVVPANFDSIRQLAGYVRRRLAEGTSHSPQALAEVELRAASNGPAETSACAGSGDPACRPI